MKIAKKRVKYSVCSELCKDFYVVYQLKMVAGEVESIIYRAIRTPEDAERLQEDLCALQEWQQRWLMRLNVSKCFTMTVLHPRRNKIITPYRLHNHLLSPVEHYKIFRHHYPE